METNANTPTLWEVSQMSRDFGLVGERQTHLTVLLSTINGGLVIMSSPSRSGKDMIVDAVEYCRPGDDIARIPNSSSPTVLYQRADELNSANVHRYPDITSLEEHIESLLKANGDGRSSSHEYTDVTGDERTIVEQTITPPKSMVLFAASDNNKVDLNNYPEVRNRALIVSTDTSADLTSRIKQRQAEIEAGLYDYKTTQDRRGEIREYIGSIPVNLYTDDNDMGEVWNLTHPGFADENPLPDLFPESRMDFERFNKFVKAVTLFHYDDRLEVGVDNRDPTVSLISAPKDLWLAWIVFGEKMVLSALNLKDQDFKILNLLRDAPEAKTLADIQNDIRRQGENMSDTIIRNSLDSMNEKGYILKDNSGGRVKYQPSPFATADTVSKNIDLDFGAVIERTEEVAETVLPDNEAAEYIEQFCQGEGLIATHPTEGHQINIEEYDLTDSIEDKAEQEEEIVDENNPFDNSSDDEGTDRTAQDRLGSTIG